MPAKTLLRCSRGVVRQQITKKCKWVETNIDSMTRSDLCEQLSAVSDLKVKIADLNERVLQELWQSLDSNDDSDQLVADEMDTCFQYDDYLNKIVTIVNSRIAASPAAPVGVSETGTPRLKLPELPLPKFSNKEGEDLSKFFREFESVVDRYNIGTHLKFTLLTGQLGGDPAKLISSLDCSKHSYEDAKLLLQEAFADTLTQQYGIIKQMSELRLALRGDPYEFISKMRAVISQFDELGITKELILQYFIWNSLNDCFKNQLIQITGSNKPTLKEINDNIFIALERYKNISKPSADKKLVGTSGDSTNLAVSVHKFEKSKASDCVLCLYDGAENVSHPIFKCSKYDTPQSKFNKLKHMGHCTSCTYSGHLAPECKFKFRKRCMHCHKWHFNFLCLPEQKLTQNSGNKSSPKDDCNKKKGGTQNATASALVWTESEVLQVFCNPVTAMPTFSLNSIGDRAVKDSGSQISFVENDWAVSQGFEIIDENYSLVVNGINSRKPITTRVFNVEFRGYEFPAVSMTSININLSLPGIADVAQAFRDKGYDLADNTLHLCGDEIHDIKLILGSDNAHLLPQTDMMFGNSDIGASSLYLVTPIGVMLTGNIDNYKHNLPDLPFKDRQGFSSVATSLPTVTHDINDVGLDVKEVQEPDMYTQLVVLGENGNLLESELEKAVKEIVNSDVKSFFNYDQGNDTETSIVEHDRLVEYALENSTRNYEGRIVMPLLWNSRVSHYLGKNQNLAKAILKSNFRKYSKQKDTFLIIDSVFREQEALGIIERIDNPEQYLQENPQYSFLPHMPVFRPDHDTTKCRNVFLSNLCEPDDTRPMTVSHNQAICAGPCLNKKLSTSVLQLRFNEKLLCFDLKKAFLMIELSPLDQSRLLFYWYKNVAKQDFSLAVYKNCRLPFGLTCSPTLLMLALYKILIIDADKDDDGFKKLKRNIYDLAYMDNLAYSANESEELKDAYLRLGEIFSPYKFGLQQFVTNDSDLQKCIDDEQETPKTVKLLGLVWNREHDTLSTRKLSLDKTAFTKRTILSSLASNFDVYLFNGPLLNRARLFMHRLQCMKDLDWDDRLSSDLMKEWSCICRQINNSPEIEIKRCIGRKDDSYELIAFCDSSKDIYGTVLYAKNLRTGELNFLLAKNRIIGKSNSNTIPALELQAVCLATETLIDTYNELCGSSCIAPMKVERLEVFSDSAVALNWINSFVNKFGKMRKRNVFVMNRLHKIERLCAVFPVRYSFCAGLGNPADCITRPLSHKQLMKSNYFTGPDLKANYNDVFDIVIPNPLTNISQVSEEYCGTSSAVKETTKVNESVLSLEPEGSLQRRLKIGKHVLTFINNCKRSVRQKYPDRYDHFQPLSDKEIMSKVWLILINDDQRKYFPDILEYFLNATAVNVTSMPNLVGQLNLFPDSDGIIRVKSKFRNWKGKDEFPILLAKGSTLTEQIVLKYHRELFHSGVYGTLSEVRKRFWIPCHFSVIKKVLKDCIHCRRFNGRTIKLNQSPYREFRVSPPTIPYRYVFVDFFGPYWIYWEGKKVKAWVLCLTCLWSRAINLKVCIDLTVNSFLRAFQLHCFEFGVPELCLSDHGTQLVAGGKIIESFLTDPDTKAYFNENGIKPLSFQHYYKGQNELGSLVEICVKMTKRLIEGSIRNLILKYLEFDFVINNVVHLVNRRPIAFKEYLRSSDPNDSLPSPITPEILLKGHELNSLNVIPQLHPLPLSDPDWSPDVCLNEHVRDSYKKLRKAREYLINIYNTEFLAKLMDQATDKKGRYQPMSHKLLGVGDVVLIKDPLSKPTNFPMGIVREVQVNSLGEVTGATIMKGKSREMVKRHASSLIPLLGRKEYANGELTESSEPNTESSEPNTSDDISQAAPRPMRKAALKCMKNIKSLIKDDRL